MFRTCPYIISSNIENVQGLCLENKVLLLHVCQTMVCNDTCYLSFVFLTICLNYFDIFFFLLFCVFLKIFKGAYLTFKALRDGIIAKRMFLFTRIAN